MSVEMLKWWLKMFEISLSKLWRKAEIWPRKRRKNMSRKWNNRRDIQLMFGARILCIFMKDSDDFFRKMTNISYNFSIQCGPLWFFYILKLPSKKIIYSCFPAKKARSSCVFLFFMEASKCAMLSLKALTTFLVRLIDFPCLSMKFWQIIGACTFRNQIFLLRNDIFWLVN